MPVCLAIASRHSKASTALVGVPPPVRSRDKSTLATCQPLLSSPTMLVTGTRTSSKNTSASASSSAMVLIGRTVMPLARMSESRKEMPACGFASGSVRTRKKIQSACAAPWVQIFWPLTTK